MSNRHKLVDSEDRDADLCALIFALLGLTDYTSDINAASVASVLLIFIGVYLVSKPAKKVKNVT